MDKQGRIKKRNDRLKTTQEPRKKGFKMFKIFKKTVAVLLLVCIATASLGCLNINKPPDDQPKKDVNVGGDHGVTVER
jgi:cell division septal protein FtsQ